jgi:hypothetical protein
MRGNINSRIGKHRADVVHHTLDPLIVAGPWLLAAGLVFLAVRSLIRSTRSKTKPERHTADSYRYRDDRRLHLS